MTFNVVHEKKAERLLTKQDFEIVFRTKIWLTTVCLFLLCLVVFLFFYFFGHWQNLIYDLSCTIWAEMKKVAGFVPESGIQTKPDPTPRLVSFTGLIRSP